MKKNERTVTRTVAHLDSLLKRRSNYSSLDLPYTSSETRTLTYILSSQRSVIYQRDVEREFMLRPSSATEILQKLERKGLIRREQEAVDARKKQIIPTEKAIKVGEEMRKRMQKTEEVVVRNISPEDLETFYQVCEAMIYNISDEIIREERIW